jgi:ribulose 1,5-bisphosphate synthetase/thiazole synthase
MQRVDFHPQLPSCSTDLLVVGAGAAGVAATRQGLRVSVVKHYGFCGGGLSLP